MPAGLTAGVFFSRTDKPMNSTMLVEGGKQFECLIKDNNSIIEPEILIRVEDPEELFEYNYFKIPIFSDRGYFITDITSETSKAWWIKGTVDVLGSFRDAILETNAFIQYSESNYNTFIPDSRLKITDSSNLFSVSKQLPGLSNEGCYLVTIASSEASGVTGACTVYVMSQSEIKELAERLNDTSLWTTIIDKIHGDPIDSIIKCMWIPCERSRVMMTTSSPIYVNGVNIASGAPAAIRFEEEVEVTPHVHYHTQTMMPPSMELVESWRDFRNVEPYSDYTLWLPGVGLMQIPMIAIIGTGTEEPKFKLTMQVSTTTGEVHYTVRRTASLDSTVEMGDKIIEATGYFGCDLPVSSLQSGIVDAIPSIAGGAVSIGLSALAGPVGLAASMAAFGALQMETGLIQSAYTTPTVKGAMGGFLMNETEKTNVIAITRVHTLTDDPSNIASSVGRPLYAHRRLGLLHGLVKCTGAYVRAFGATRDEQERISQLVNSSTNFIYGGVIIE